MTSHIPRLPLQDLALKPASLRSYNTQLNSFLNHARLSPQQLLSVPAIQLDRQLAVYMQHMFDCAAPFTYASHALCAVVFHRPDVKHHLFVARQCLRGWERVNKSMSYPPLTWEL